MATLGTPKSRGHGTGREHQHEQLSEKPPHGHQGSWNQIALGERGPKPLKAVGIQAFQAADSRGFPPTRDGWNLYAYVGNNPVNYVDPNGLELQIVGETTAVEAAQEITNTGLFGQELAVDAGGNATLVSNGVQGPQTVAQQALSQELSTVIDNPGTTTVRVTQSSFIVGGDFKSGVVDVGDISKFGTSEPASQSSIFLHEVVEQFNKQVNSMNFTAAHQQGMNAEQRIHGLVRGVDSTGEVGGLPAIFTPYSGSGGQVTVVTRARFGAVVDVRRQRQ